MISIRSELGAHDLLAGGNGVMVSMQAGHFVPIPFAEMVDPVNGKALLLSLEKGADAQQ